MQPASAPWRGRKRRGRPPSCRWRTSRPSSLHREFSPLLDVPEGAEGGLVVFAHRRRLGATLRTHPPRHLTPGTESRQIRASACRCARGLPALLTRTSTVRPCAAIALASTAPFPGTSRSTGTVTAFTPVGLREPVGDVLQRGFRTGGEDEIVAVFREAFGEIDADAHAGARDERGLTFACHLSVGYCARTPTPRIFCSLRCRCREPRSTSVRSPGAAAAPRTLR